MKQIPSQTTIQLLYEHPPSAEQVLERIAAKKGAREHAMTQDGPKQQQSQKKVMLMHKGGGAAAEGGGAADQADDDTRLRTLLSPVTGEVGTSGESGCGLIFIGFETHQSTGFGFHVNAQVL
jgi:hypothetical protein